MIHKTLLSGTIFAALFSTQLVLADAGYYIWDDAKGFVSSQKCKPVETNTLPLFIVDSSSANARELSVSKSNQIEVPDRSVIRVFGNRTAQTNVQILGTSSTDASLISQKGTMSSQSIKELNGRVIGLQAGSPAATYGKSEILVAGSFLEIEMKDGSYLVSRCGSGDNAKGYMLFNVFTPDSADPVAEIGILASQTKILNSSYAYTGDEAISAASKLAGAGPVAPSIKVSGTASGGAASDSSEATTEPSKEKTPDTMVDEGTDPYAICTPHGLPTNLMDANNKVIGQVNDGSLAQAIDTDTRQARVGGHAITLINIQLLNQDNTGWVDQSVYMRTAACSKTVALAEKPVVLKPVAPPTPPPAPAAPPAPPKEVDMGTISPGKPSNCAEATIIKKAKVAEADKYGRADHSGGHCAHGVFVELDASKVGGITEPLGEGAVDYLAGLTARGYINSGVTDPRLAPAGAVIIFKGANSDLYLRTHQEKESADGSYNNGNWAGHITIKGDDGYYYTDAREKHPAVGWSDSGVNQYHVRNVAEILIPGPSLVEKFEGQCPGMSN